MIFLQHHLNFGCQEPLCLCKREELPRLSTFGQDDISCFPQCLWRSYEQNNLSQYYVSFQEFCCFKISSSRAHWIVCRYMTIPGSSSNSGLLQIWSKSTPKGSTSPSNWWEKLRTSEIPELTSDEEMWRAECSLLQTFLFVFNQLFWSSDLDSLPCSMVSRYLDSILWNGLEL